MTDSSKNEIELIQARINRLFLEIDFWINEIYQGRKQLERLYTLHEQLSLEMKRLKERTGEAL